MSPTESFVSSCFVSRIEGTDPQRGFLFFKIKEVSRKEVVLSLKDPARSNCLVVDVKGGVLERRERGGKNEDPRPSSVRKFGGRPAKPQKRHAGPLSLATSVVCSTKLGGNIIITSRERRAAVAILSTRKCRWRKIAFPADFSSLFSTIFNNRRIHDRVSRV